MKLSVPQFWKHVLTVLTGSVVAQALPLLAAPLITRLATPPEIGAFSVWIGVIYIAAVVATLRLETAMILDNEKAEQQTCFNVVAYSATALAIVISIGALFGHIAGVPQLANIPILALLLIGPGTWLMAYTQTILAYATSHNAFGKSAKAKIWSAGSIAFFQVLLLWLGVGGTALMIGQVTGLAIGLVAAKILLAPPIPEISLTLDKTQKQYLKKHNAFWKFSLPSDLISAIVAQLPLFLIGARHGVLAAGLFALTQRVLAAPISLLASSVQEVFKRESVYDYKTQGHCREAYLRTFKALAWLGAGPALFLFFFAPDFFVFVFGEPWREAGELARIMAPLNFLNFVASPLSYVFYVAGKQKIALIWQITLFGVTTAAFLLPLSLRQNVALYAAGYSFLYIVFLVVSYRLAQPKVRVA